MRGCLQNLLRNINFLLRDINFLCRNIKSFVKKNRLSYEKYNLLTVNILLNLRLEKFELVRLAYVKMKRNINLFHWKDFKKKNFFYWISVKAALFTSLGDVSLLFFLFDNLVGPSKLIFVETFEDFTHGCSLWKPYTTSVGENVEKICSTVFFNNFL